MVRDFNQHERDGLHDLHIGRTKRKRDNYFTNRPHKWFAPMQCFLSLISLGWSYAGSTAIHIDIVACATKPSWRDLGYDAQQRLARNCRPSFMDTLSKLRGGTWLLVDGNAAFKALRQVAKVVQRDTHSSKPGVSIHHGDAQIENRTLRHVGWDLILHHAKFQDVVAIVDYCRLALDGGSTDRKSTPRATGLD
jgi:hypothetical protein